jgi:RNA polymerase sigma-70 factor (ECF subfamily)
MNSASAHTRFEALVQTWSADLYRYAYWLCHSQMQAEELVQETFLRAWRSLHSLRNERAAKSWLITILRREHARTYQRRALAVVEGADPDEFGASRSDVRPEVVLLRRALRQLSERYREPLLLQVLGGYSTHEIGETLGLSKEAVLSRLFRARRKLRATLEGNEDDRIEQEMNS